MYVSAVCVDDGARGTDRPFYSAGMTRALPDTVESLLIRTDFSDDAGWRATVEAASQPWDLGGGVITGAHLLVVDDAALDGLTLVELAEVIDGPPPYYVFLADADTIANPEHSILAVDTTGDPVNFPTFRVHPSQMPSVENNLSLANMDFDDFASAVGADGVFRGFGPPPTKRVLSKAALLDAIDRSTLSTEAIIEYRAALEDSLTDDESANFTPDMRSSHDDLVTRRHEYNEYSSWIVGLDESINALGAGGAALVIRLIASTRQDRLHGSCTVWVDPVNLVPIAVLAYGVPAPRRAH